MLVYRPVEYDQHSACIHCHFKFLMPYNVALFMGTGYSCRYSAPHEEKQNSFLKFL